MNQYKEVDLKELPYNPVRLIEEDWMLVTAQKDKKVNTMTASWGGVGFFWRQNVAFIFIRKSRYTKEFIDGSDTLSLTFYDTEQYRDMLSLMGKVSGRDEDKIKAAGLTLAYENDTPYFKEAKIVFLCKKMARYPLEKEGFILPEIDSSFYADMNYHDLYIVAIEKIYIKEKEHEILV